MTLARRFLLGGLAALVGGVALAQAPGAGAQPAAQPVAKTADVTVGRGGELIVPLGGIVRFKPKFKPGVTFTDVTTSNEGIVQVRPDTDSEAVQLIGLTPGVTKITFTLTDMSKGSFEVIVQPDYELLRKVIQKAVPTASIDVIPGVGNSLILGGYVNRPEDAETVMSIARAAGIGAGANIINAIQVGGLQHVQIEVVFASVNRSKIRQRGMNFSITGTEGSLISQLISPTDANLLIGIVPSNINIALQALKTEGLAKFLSEPKVVTQSGRPAIIRSGGQQAVLSATGGGLGSISVTLEEIGTTMQVLPIVYGNGKIYLEVSPSIRIVNNANGIQTTAGFSPGFSEQSASSSVMLESGQTFAIGGLLETTSQANATKVPVLGEIPYVGFLFSQQRYEERESELVILVTPRLVDAMDCAQVPKRVPTRESRSVDDYEFYLEGLMEAPRGQRKVWNGRCYQAAYKCDTTYGTFPCRGNVCGDNNGGSKGNCGSGCTPTALPAAPAPKPMGTSSTSAPVESLPTTADPIVMPNAGTLTVPDVVPGPGTRSEAPAPAPIAPGGEGK